MADYPTLSQDPDAENFTEIAAIDPTLRDEFENGYVNTRSKFTSVKKKWEIVYRFLSSVDKISLDTFQGTVNYGAGEFNWTNPIDSESYVVRFGGPIEFKVEPENGSLWRVAITLLEISVIP